MLLHWDNDFWVCMCVCICVCDLWPHSVVSGIDPDTLCDPDEDATPLIRRTLALILEFESDFSCYVCLYFEGAHESKTGGEAGKLCLRVTSAVIGRDLDQAGKQTFGWKRSGGTGLSPSRLNIVPTHSCSGPSPIHKSRFEKADHFMLFQPNLVVLTHQKTHNLSLSDRHLHSMDRTDHKIDNCFKCQASIWCTDTSKKKRSISNISFIPYFRLINVKVPPAESHIPLKNRSPKRKGFIS